MHNDSSRPGNNDRRLTPREQFTRAKKELPQGASPLWSTIAVILNILIFAGFGYMLWDAE